MQTLEVNFEAEHPIRQLLDAMPSMVLIVDADLRVLEHNFAAEAFFGLRRRGVLRTRWGDALHCVHSTDVCEGCSCGDFCKTCLVSDAVATAMNGEKSVRKRVRLELIADGKATGMEILLTASPFHYDGITTVLLILEDISEIIELQRMRPLCVTCQKVRSDLTHWMKVEDYIQKNLNQLFAQSLCPDCFKNEMGQVERSLGMLPHEQG